MSVGIITGASSGIGKEFAIQISKKFKSVDELWVVARRKERLEELKNKLKHVKVKVIPCDVTKDEELLYFKELLSKEKPDVRILVNAAGYGMIGKYDELEEDNCGMCKLNCLALTQITDMVLPYMNKKRSNIINIASSAGFLPQPSFATYAATKSYVLSLSRAMNQELKSKNITVTAVCPGPVDTEFFDIAERKNTVKLYKKLLRAKAHDVVELALRDSGKGKDVSVYGMFMKGFRVMCKILPHSLMIKFIK